MLAGRRRFLYRLKALLCAALILNINYWAGCGASSFDAARAIRINLTPDHPLTLELNNTAFGGAIALEIDPSSNQFRLIYPEPDRIIQGGYGEGRDGLALTNLATSRRGKNTSMEFNPKTKQVTRVISARGDQWQPEKVLSARELPVGLTGVDAYVAANPELMSLVVDPTKVDEVLSLSGKDNSAQLVIDPTVILLAFLFQFCPGCLGYLLLFTIFQIIADVIFNYLSQQPNDGDDGDDGDGGSQPLPTPAPPIARPDAATTPEDTPVTIDVLANDEDADFGLAVSSVRIVLAPASGTTSVNALTGAITYTPNTDFNGPDAFAYEVCDAGAVPLCATTVVSVTVTPLNDPPMAFNDVGATFEDDPPLSLPFAALLANDTDVDLPTGDMLAISNVTDSFLGAVVTIVGTNVIYDHSSLFQNLSAGANTTDLFTYTMQDLAGSTSIATVTINITGRNDDPIAVDDEFAVDADSSATTQPASFFLANDTDIDADDVLTIVSIDATSATGAVSLDSNEITYDPGENFLELGAGQNATDTFTYTIDDARGGQDTAFITVTINGVNDPPVAMDDEAEATEDGDPVTLFGPDLLANDFDIDIGDSIAISNVTDSAASAVVSIVGDDVIYNHTGLFQELAAGANTTDTFTYTIEDLAGLTASATVTMTVTGVNDPPVAEDDMVEVLKDAPPLVIPIVTIFSNDSDIDIGDTFFISNVTDSMAGAAVSIVGDDVIYDFTGLFNDLGDEESTTDTFTYTIEDTFGAQSTATVTVTVNGSNDEPIVAKPSVLNVDEDSQDNPLNIAAPTDPDVGDMLTITVTGLPDGMLGTVTLADGTPVMVSDVLSEAELTGLLFDAALDASGPAGDFAYDVTDGLATVGSTVTINVAAVADAPNLNVMDTSGLTNEAIALDITASLVDTDGSETLSITVENVPLDAALSAGTDNGGGMWTLTPGDLAGLTLTAMTADTIMLSVTATATETSNNDMASTMDTLTVTVEAENNPPLVDEPSVLNVDEDSQDNPLNIAAPTDPDAGDMLTITVTGLPDAMLGTVTLADGTPVMVTDVLSEADLTGLLFDAALDASGAAGDFAYDVTDGLATVGSTVTINVAAVADAPNLTVMDTSGLTNEAIALDITASLVDTDGSETLAITIDNVPLDAVLSAGTDNGSGSWTLAPGDLAGLTLTAMTADTIMLSVTATATETSNNDMASTMDTLTITVEAENNPPQVAEPSVLNFDEDSQDNPLNIAAPTDPDASDMLTITVTGLPDAMLGTVTLSDGTPVMITDVLSEADLTGLLFDSALDASGAAGDFAYDVTDGLATVGSTVTINVAAVADAPNLTVMGTSGLTNEDIALDITASLVDTDGSETLSITVENVPLDAVLSAGTDNGGGSWTLATGDLAGLTLTAMTADTIMLAVTATATETSNNDMVSTMDTLTVTVTMQALTLFTEGNDTVDFNTLVAGQFSKTEYYDALGGDDMVTLPDIGAGPSDFDKSITFFGGNGMDTIQGGNRADMIEGGDDNDTLFGGPGADTLTGGPGDDMATGGLGPDFFFAGTGNDTYMSDSRMTGGFFTENGSDAFDGEDDVDVLQLSGGGWTVMVMGVGTLTPGDFIGGSYTQAGAAFGGMVMVTLSGSADPTQDGVHGIQFVNIEEIRLVDGSLK